MIAARNERRIPQILAFNADFSKNLSAKIRAICGCFFSVSICVNPWLKSKGVKGAFKIFKSPGAVIVLE
jgi:hypothetical protein